MIITVFSQYNRLTEDILMKHHINQYAICDQTPIAVESTCANNMIYLCK